MAAEPARAAAAGAAPEEECAAACRSIAVSNLLSLGHFEVALALLRYRSRGSAAAQCSALLRVLAEHGMARSGTELGSVRVLLFRIPDRRIGWCLNALVS